MSERKIVFTVGIAFPVLLGVVGFIDRRLSVAVFMLVVSAVGAAGTVGVLRTMKRPPGESHQLHREHVNWPALVRGSQRAVKLFVAAALLQAGSYFALGKMTQASFLLADALVVGVSVGVIIRAIKRRH